jgi:hypothetical protein
LNYVLRSYRWTWLDAAQRGSQINVSATGREKHEINKTKQKTKQNKENKTKHFLNNGT